MNVQCKNLLVQSLQGASERAAEQTADRENGLARCGREALASFAAARDCGECGRDADLGAYLAAAAERFPGVDVSR